MHIDQEMQLNKMESPIKNSPSLGIYSVSPCQRGNWTYSDVSRGGIGERFCIGGCACCASSAFFAARRASHDFFARSLITLRYSGSAHLSFASSLLLRRYSGSDCHCFAFRLRTSLLRALASRILAFVSSERFCPIYLPRRFSAACLVRSVTIALYSGSFNCLRFASLIFLRWSSDSGLPLCICANLSMFARSFSLFLLSCNFFICSGVNLCLPLLEAARLAICSGFTLIPVWDAMRAARRSGVSFLPFLALLSFSFVSSDIGTPLRDSAICFICAMTLGLALCFSETILRASFDGLKPKLLWATLRILYSGLISSIHCCSRAMRSFLSSTRSITMKVDASLPYLFQDRCKWGLWDLLVLNPFKCSLALLRRLVALPIYRKDVTLLRMAYIPGTSGTEWYSMFLNSLCLVPCVVCRQVARFHFSLRVANSQIDDLYTLPFFMDEVKAVTMGRLR